jgi:hypothetical protein
MYEYAPLPPATYLPLKIQWATYSPEEYGTVSRQLYLLWGRMAVRSACSRARLLWLYSMDA